MEIPKSRVCSLEFNNITNDLKKITVKIKSLTYISACFTFNYTWEAHRPQS